MKYLLLFFFCCNLLAGQAQPGAGARPAKGPKALIDSNFYMAIEDVFAVQGRGIAITGRVSTGKARVGQVLHIKGYNERPIEVRVNAIDKYREQPTEAKPGESVGFLFTSGFTIDQVRRGMVLTEPDFGAADTTAEVELTILAGQNLTYRNGDIIRMYINGQDVTGCRVVLPAGQTLRAGRKGKAKIVFPFPVFAVTNLFFSIRSEQFRIVGNGQVVKAPAE